MPTGDSILRELRSELDELRADAATLRGEHQAADTQLRRLVSDRGAAILDLARHYLPEISRERIEVTFAEVRDDLQQILSRKERQQDVLVGQRDRLRQECERLEGELAGVTAQLSEKVRERELLSRQLADQLAADIEFRQLSATAIAAESELSRNEQRLRELEQDAAENLPDYQQSSLFQYLLQSGYGTETYARRGLTKRLDRWVARLIDYPRAFRSYQFLTSAPQLVREEIERRAAVFHPQMAAVEAFEQRAADAMGLTQVLQAGDELGARRDQLVTLVGEQRSLLHGVEQKLLELEQSQGPFYQEALTRFRQFLERARTEILEQQAARTPEPIDDELVQRIRALTDEINRVQPELARQQERCRLAEDQVGGLEFVVRRFQQANFDSPRSQFESSLALRKQLDQYRQRALSREALWDQLRQAQQFEPTWLEESAQGMAVNATQVLAHPMTQVLMHAMVEAAGVALQAAAQRSVERRSYPSRQRGAQRMDTPRPQWQRTNTPPVRQPRPTQPAPPVRTASPKPRGFTTGDGF
ncbi:MAG: hypothetical protein KDA90_06910 [Planctomycetaceae bacterium]|nr:hypothetical protein [Planctomycetaceae bacterium]